MQVTYWVLFGLIAIVPALGVVEVFATGHSIDLGLVRLSCPLKLTPEGLSTLTAAHHLLGVALLMLGGIHALTASSAMVAATSHFRAHRLASVGPARNFSGVPASNA